MMISDGQTSEQDLNIMDTLIEYRHSQLNEGNRKEASVINNLIRETEPEVYLDEHSRFGFCCCRSEFMLEENFICSSDNLYQVPNMLWNHFMLSSYGQLPRSLVRLLTECINMRTDEGLTLMHLVAASSHPQVDEFNIHHRAGKTLIRFGCPLNAIDEGGITPLNLALLSKNSCIAELLLKEGVRVHDPQRWLQYFAEHHDHEALQIVLASGESDRRVSRASLLEHLCALGLNEWEQIYR